MTKGRLTPAAIGGTSPEVAEFCSTQSEAYLGTVRRAVQTLAGIALTIPPRQSSTDFFKFMYASSGVMPPAPKGAACQRGCSHCCHQHVFVSSSEAFAIWLWLNRQGGAASEVSPERFERAQELRGMSHFERWERRIPCAFLSLDGKCGIYPSRPEACRNYYSADAGACEKGSAPIFANEQFHGTAIAVARDMVLHASGFNLVYLELTSAMAELAAIGGGRMLQDFARGAQPFKHVESDEYQEELLTIAKMANIEFQREAAPKAPAGEVAK